MMLEIRPQVMWPDKPLSFVQVPGDGQATHSGGFVNGKMVSIISLFIDKKEALFREFATLSHDQGKGYGTTLLQYVFAYLKPKDIKRVACRTLV